MSPRKYSMEKRAAAAEETRRRILDSAVKLHGERGVIRTSWQDIAQDADVAVGTVYYHFPTVDDLVPACTAHGMEQMPMPTSEIFTGLRSQASRIEVLVRELFLSYEKLAGHLAFTFIERKVVQVLAQIADEMLAEIRALVAEALGDGVSEEQIDRASALVDHRFWEALTERGLERDEMVELVSSLVRRIARHGT